MCIFKVYLHYNSLMLFFLSLSEPLFSLSDTQFPGETVVSFSQGLLSIFCNRIK